MQNSILTKVLEINQAKCINYYCYFYNSILKQTTNYIFLTMTVAKTNNPDLS